MKRVLIVDDSTFLRMMLRKIIEKNGFEVVGEGKNGLEGIKLYKKLRPDIVTMDITMPDMDGIEGVKGIKAIDKNAKIVMISSMGQQSFVRDAVIAGAVNFIVKPFNEEKVVQVLNSL